MRLEDAQPGTWVRIPRGPEGVTRDDPFETEPGHWRVRVAVTDSDGKWETFRDVDTLILVKQRLFA